MDLSYIDGFNKIVIQCHDNPDADAIASGYTMYKYCKEKGKEVRLIYGGRNKVQKSNLVLLINTFEIPIEYIQSADDITELNDGALLLTVDCQYGAGNVTKFEAKNVAIIDHHQVEIEDVENTIIRSDLGSCSTLVWMLVKANDFEIDDDLGTILYYGLFSDTNQFSELYNPLDRDMMDQIPHDNRMIGTLKNSNISLRELEVAGVAMLRYSYNEEYGFAVIKSQPCDPNILGLISDFLLQVDSIRTCVVFNEVGDGYKFSVRSCVKEVNASELAGYLAKGIGSGGGHYEKAGGFISEKLYREQYATHNAEAYFNNRLTEYFDTYEIIHAKNYEADITSMKLYKKKPMPIGFVKTTDMLPVGTPITVRSLEGDSDLFVEDDLYIMIGIKGEVYPSREAKVLKSNKILDKKYVYDECVIDNTYVPTIKNRITGQNMLLTDYAHVCIPTGDVQIYVKQLEKGIKVFTAWDKEKYMLGQPGDFLAVRTDDMHDVYVIERKIFGLTYEAVE